MSQETYYEPNTSDRPPAPEPLDAQLARKVKALEDKAAAIKVKRTTVKVSGERTRYHTDTSFMIDAGPDCVCSYDKEVNVLTLKGSKIDMELDNIKLFTIETVEI